MKKVRDISKDNVPHYIHVLKDRVLLFISNVFSKIYFRYWGVSLGSHVRFYGLPVIRRHPNSSITIFDSCSFRSAPYSNSVGLNHRCIISTLGSNAKIAIGNNTGLSGCSISAMTCVTIGEYVLIGANTVISDTDWHPISIEDRIEGKPGSTSPVSIGNHVWLGMGVVVLKGVTIGDGSIIAANSVVTRSIPAGVVAAGNPAKVIKILGN